LSIENTGTYVLDYCGGVGYCPWREAPGSWRFWVNLNNADSEWRQLLHCNSCVPTGPNGTLTDAYLADTNRYPGGTHFYAPWTTNGFLGLDALLFPGQPLLLQTTGYHPGLFIETDCGYFVGGPDLGTTADRVPLTPGLLAVSLNSHSAGGCIGAAYTVNYNFTRMAPPPVALTPEALDLYNAYVYHREDLNGRQFIAPVPPLVVHPSQVVVQADSVVEFAKFPIFEPYEIEENVLPGVSNGDFQRTLASAARNNLGSLNPTLEKIRQGLLLNLNADPSSRDEMRFFLPILEDSLPQALYSTYFGSFGHPPICNAGGPYTVDCPTSGSTYIRLNGTGSSDPDSATQLSYAWRTSAGRFESVLSLVEN
jgi:hypothetical protein